MSDGHEIDPEPDSEGEFIWLGEVDPEKEEDTACWPDGGFQRPSSHPDARNDPVTPPFRASLDWKRVAAFSALLILGIGLFTLLSGQSIAHATFTANDVSLTSNSGQLTSLTVAPEGDVHYSGLESEPSSVDIEVQVRESGSTTWETVDTTSESATGLEGSLNFSFAEIDLLTESSLQSSGFRAADGETSSNDVEVRIRATLVGAGPNGDDIVTTSADTFTVTVTNEPAGASAGGQGNTDGSAA